MTQGMAGRRGISGPRASALAIVLIAALAATAPAPGHAADQGRITPIVVDPIPQKKIIPVEGSDGRWHLMYEFQLTNSLKGDADLRSVSAVDTEDKRTLLDLDAEEIIAGEYLHTLNQTSATTTVFESNQSRILILNLSFPSKRAVPERITHRFRVAGAQPFGGRPTTFSYPAGKLRISGGDPPVLSPPLLGEGWLASNAPPGPTSHVNAIIGIDGKLQAAERWAIDWIQIDASGRVYNGESTDPESWVGYGATIVAAKKGVVTAARDGMPNATPGDMPPGLTFDELPGNYVAVEMKGGLTAVYAHMKPGSVAVEVGDRVKTGRALGELGNSGASAAPHLHFHVVNGPHVAASDGYPFVFDSFELAAQSDINALLAALKGEAGFPTRDEMSPVARADQLPLDFTINDFDAG
jgi:murein DD-endopeptidase MepM/ murein hydrolase activator NlpD